MNAKSDTMLYLKRHPTNENAKKTQPQRKRKELTLPQTIFNESAKNNIIIKTPTIAIGVWLSRDFLILVNEIDESFFDIFRVFLTYCLWYWFLNSTSGQFYYTNMRGYINIIVRQTQLDKRES